VAPVHPNLFQVMRAALQISLSIGAILFLVLVTIRRAQARKRGRYVSRASMGFALQQMEALVRPQVEYQLQELTREDADADDQSGPDDPTRYYRGLRQRIDECAELGRQKLETSSSGELVQSASACENAETMELIINGEEQEFTAISTVSTLLAQLGMKPDRVAVELNHSLIPRDRWTTTQLSDGDKLEIVHFVGGGS
jgi:sulfur carrier protein